MVTDQDAQGVFFQERKAGQGSFGSLVMVDAHKTGMPDDQVVLFFKRNSGIAFQLGIGSQVGRFQMAGEDSSKPVS